MESRESGMIILETNCKTSEASSNYQYRGPTIHYLYYLFIENCVSVPQYRRCDLWHHMFTKDPQSLDFLQARFVHSSMKENIKSYILWRVHCLILVNFLYDERGTSQNLSNFYFHNSWFYVEIMTLCQLSHRTV